MKNTIQLAKKLQQTIEASPYDLSTKVMRNLLDAVRMLEQVEDYVDIIHEAGAKARHQAASPSIAKDSTIQLPPDRQADETLADAAPVEAYNESQDLTASPPPCDTRQIAELLNRQRRQLRVVSWAYEFYLQGIEA